MEQLPEGVERILLRGDSALYENELLDWLDEQGIGYAISADLSPQLRAAIEALPESQWQLECDEGEALRHWAEVPLVPEDPRHRKDAPARRARGGAHPQEARAPGTPTAATAVTSRW